MARTFLTGFLLGWSVAWPPGPINAEAIRRGLTRGFWAAYLVVIGGCAGDATWAVLASLAADRLRGPRVQLYLGVLSVVLLIFLALIFFRGAWRECRHQAHSIARSRSGSSFLVGLTLALTSPWSIAFWIAVVGQTQGFTRSFATSLLFVAAVVVGAATWGLFLSATAGRLGKRLQSPWWGIATQFLTGLLMLAFAIRTATRLRVA